MIRRFLTLCLAMIFGIAAWSQNDQTKEINRIKKDRNYLTVTGTSMVSEKESSDNALIMLAAEIEDWIKENAKGDVTGYTAKAKQSAGFIKTKMGSLYRTFAYVKKTDILPYYKNDIIINNQPQTQTAAKADTTASTKAVPQTKTVTSPQKLTPSKDTVTANTKVQTVTKKVVESKAQAPTVNKADSTKQQEKVTEIDNSILARLFKKKKKKEAETTQTTKVTTTQNSKPDYAEEAKMLTLLSANAVKKYLNNLIDEDKMDRFGEISDYPKQGIAYMLLSDYHGIVREYVRLTDGKAVSLKTGKSVNLSTLSEDYSAKYSIWFTLK